MGVQIFNKVEVDPCQLEFDPSKDEVKFFFTSEDIVKLIEYFNTGNRYSLQGLVDYFNAKLECNRIAELLKLMIEGGVTIYPKVMFRPVTERCRVINGEFQLTQEPYPMDGFYFLNNLVVVKRDDNTYDFFDDALVDVSSKLVRLSDENISGYATVSYYVMVTEDITSTP